MIIKGKEEATETNPKQKIKEKQGRKKVKTRQFELTNNRKREKRKERKDQGW